jgi:serine/threonine protein kinase
MTLDPERLKEIFLAAADLGSSDERHALLDRECGSDLELRQQLEALLRAHDDSAGFLAAGGDAAPSADAAPPAEEVGTRIGPYKLLQPIGEGGMGTVYMAEQEEPVHRQVALKIIKPGMDSRQIIARFEAERQALALMDHPHIAKVFDAGTTASGRPYFVMELVKGMPLTRFCDERRLDLRERLELAVPVCQAVQHAHQKGIIHRDLKPSNVLVSLYDGRPVPKVIDFGLAKATGPKLTERTLFTAFGAVVGTLEYMAPEQAEVNQLDVDTRADIYSLGVLLYELLTGGTPLERGRLKKAALLEVLRLIREHEPPRPSVRLSSSDTLANVAALRSTEPAKLTKLVRGELDWIVMKCLEKDRDRRYETANGLARDLQRYLADEPVQACPPSAGYRLRKLARKHRTALLTAIAFAGLLIAGVVVSTWQAVRARQAEAQALLERDQKDEQRRRAKANLDRAIKAVDQMLTRVGEQRLTHLPQFDEERRKLLEDALALYQGLLEENSAEPEVRLETGRATKRMGDINSLLGRHLEAEHSYLRSISLLGDLATEYPAIADYQHALAKSYLHLGKLYVLYLGGPKRRGEAEAVLLKALAINQQLGRDYPAVAEYQIDQASVQLNLGFSRRAAGRLAEAEAALVQTVAIGHELNRDHLAISEYQEREAMGNYELGYLYRQMGRLPEAERAYKDALALMKAAAQDPAVPRYRRELADTYNELGALYRLTRRFDEAQKAHQEAVALNQALVRDHPAAPEYQASLANTHIFLANLYSYTRQREKEEQALQEALPIRRDLAVKYPAVRPYQGDLALCLCNLGTFYLTTARPKEAERVYQEAAATLRVLAQDHPTNTEYRKLLAGCYKHLATSYRFTERPKEAEDTFREALTIAEKLAVELPTGADYQDLWASILNEMAQLARDRANLAEARQLLQQALPHHRAALEVNRRDERYRLNFRRNRQALVEVLERLGDHAGLATVGEELAGLGWDPATSCYDAACILSRCIPVLGKDNHLKAVEREKQERAYTERALELLRQAVAKGYKDVGLLKQDSDLKPLRSREDFQKLVAELEATATKP